MSFTATAKVISVTDSVNGGSMSLQASDPESIKNADSESVNSVQISLAGGDFSHYSVGDEVAVSFKPIKAPK